MLGTLDFTVSEHWAPFNFPQSTALVTCKPEPPVRWEHIILRSYNIRILEVRPCYSPKLVDSVTNMSRLKHQKSSPMEPKPCYLNGQTILLSLIQGCH